MLQIFFCNFLNQIQELDMRDDFFERFQQSLGPKYQQQLKSMRFQQVAIRAYWRHQKKKIGKINMCSGFLLQDQLIVTSAHNIYLDQIQSFATDLIVIFLETGITAAKINKKGTSVLLKLKVNENFMCDLIELKGGLKTYKYDIALISLNRMFLKERRIKSLVGLTLDSSNSLYALISGFPDLQAQDSKEFRIKFDIKGQESSFLSTLKDDRGIITKINSTQIYYSGINTVTGQSGGPILTLINEEIYLIGIHNEYSNLTNTGKGIYFGQKIWNVLSEWASKLKNPLQSKNHCFYKDIQVELNQESRQNRKQIPQNNIIDLQNNQLFLSHSPQSLLSDSVHIFLRSITSFQDQLQELKQDVERYMKDMEQICGKVVQYDSQEFNSYFQGFLSGLQQQIQVLKEKSYSFFDQRFKKEEGSKSPLSFDSPFDDYSLEPLILQNKELLENKKPNGQIIDQKVPKIAQFESSPTSSRSSQP